MWKNKKDNGGSVPKELIEEAVMNVTEEEAEELMRKRKIPEELKV